ncbi:hypothetical protein Trichorick_00714 [Candidatus Trichorickettsia mobilis]|uniref:Uncharacterized protein n=1 Tax=Candidatus Trichorickettsia mobilis TaxID=1346319 RepID=A0ABZ0UT93_9RICK|nr:hypothetical protein [Candidatus Trichorickettsia mobilis]WPY00826.1 hypothetical protein Trichorick_00714 [Candidatus Trichorickettsia mobilis]
MVRNFIITCLLLLSINTVALAANNQQEISPSLTNQQVQQQIIDEYKAIVAKIPPEVRDEIIAFRKNIVAINKQKREAYQKLSQEAQNYLAKEQEYKKKLPIKQKQLINIQNPGEKPNKDDKAAK